MKKGDIIVSPALDWVIKNNGKEMVSTIQKAFLEATELLRKIPQGIQRAKKVHWFVDSAVTEFLKNNPVACSGDGCSGCCVNNISTCKSEALLILDFIQTSGLEVDWEMLKQHCEEGPNLSPCVFLKEGSCSIYKVRPSTCRQFFMASCDKTATYVGAGLIVITAEIMTSAFRTLECNSYSKTRMPPLLLKNKTKKE